MRHVCTRLFFGILVVAVLSGCGGGGGGGSMSSSSAPLTIVDPESIFPHQLLLTDSDTSLTFPHETVLGRSGSEIIGHRDLGPWASYDHVVTYDDGYLDAGVWKGISDYQGVRHLFVYGPTPTVPQSGIYTYTGTILGTTLEVGAPILDGQDRQLIDGKVEVVADMDLPFGNLTLSITDLRGSGERVFLDGDLFYDLVWFQEQGVFKSFNRAGNDPGVVEGTFFGERHLGGTLRHPDMDAVFAGQRGIGVPTNE